jgi:DNA-binding CsgD family transcriptional regulator
MTISDDLNALSERELEVLKLVATGATNQQIARELTISPNTVKVHLRNIFEKLGVQSRTEATMEAVRRGWVAVPGDLPPSPIAPPAQAETSAPPVETAQAAEEVVEPDKPALPPISLPELMPHAPARRPAAAWQHAFLVVALVLAVSGAVLPTWLNSRSAAASLSAFSDVGRAQVDPPARIAAQRWTAGAPLPAPRSRIALAAAGARIYAIGGETVDGVTGAVTVYDPATNGWLPAASKPTPVSNAGAGILNGLIYVAGGSLANGGVTNALEIYDPAADKWTAGPVLPRPLTAYALTVWNGKLYLFGGWDGNAFRAETLIFDPAALAWTEGPPMPGARAFAGATPVKNIVYVVGGTNGRTPLAETLAFNPQLTGAGAWAQKAPMARPRVGLAVVGVGAQVFALGGNEGAGEAFNEQFDTSVGAWSRLGTPMAGEWRNLGATALNNRIYAVGGWSGGYLDAHEQYLALLTQMIPLIITR